MDYENDAVDHPHYYERGGIECIDAIEAALTPEEFRGFLKGNIFKHIWRDGLKPHTDDAGKARWYADRLAAHGKCLACDPDGIRTVGAVDDEPRKHCETVRPGYWKRYDFGAHDDVEED